MVYDLMVNTVKYCFLVNKKYELPVNCANLYSFQQDNTVKYCSSVSIFWLVKHIPTIANRANNTCGTQCQVSSINSIARAEVKCRKEQSTAHRRGVYSKFRKSTN